MAEYLIRKYQDAKVPRVKRILFGVKIKCTDIKDAMNDNTNVHLKRLLMHTLESKTADPDHIEKSEIKVHNLDEKLRIKSTQPTELESYENLVEVYSKLLVQHLVEDLLPISRDYSADEEPEKLFKVVDDPATPGGTTYCT